MSKKKKFIFYLITEGIYFVILSEIKIETKDHIQYFRFSKMNY